MRRLSDLEVGEKAIIHDILDSGLKQKLLEMGCIPGEKIQVIRQAPFNGPIAVLISSYTLSIRRNDAQKISTKAIDNE